MIEHAPTWEKNLKRMHIYVYLNILNRLAIHLKLTQYYKSTVVVDQSLSHIYSFADPWTVTPQAPCPWDFPGENMAGVAIPFFRGSAQPRD